jgi:hypothetical protein
MNDKVSYQKLFKGIMAPSGNARLHGWLMSVKGG